jgi:uncharacterized damage-inducible protein DinB
MITIPRPNSSEFPPYYQQYIDKVPEGSLLETLSRQGKETAALLRGVPESKALHRYAPGKWSVKEVVNHVCDAERIFSYRALRFAREDATALAGFDENAYAPASRADARPLADIVAELEAIRAATLALFRGMEPAALTRSGTASGNGLSVRAVAYIIAGHERHHIGIVKERYLA